MQVRRVITAYLVTLALCLLIVASRTSPGATWTGQEAPPANGADVALSAPQHWAPTTIEPTQDPGRPVRLDLQAEDIPSTALAAYRRAAAILGQVDPGCGLRWTLIAAIGRVESNHGQTVRATLDADGISRPALDPAIHGVGPLRFFPAVWNLVAVDGDGDGRRVAEDIDDAALGAAVYLCAETEEVRTRSGMAAAIRGYNDSKRYVARVLGYEKLYRESDFLVVALSGEVAPASIVLTGPRLEATPFNRPLPSAKTRARIRADASETMARAARPGATAGPATPSPSPSPSAEPSGGAKGSQSADPQPESPPEGDRGAPSAPSAPSEEPADGSTDNSEAGQPTDDTPDGPEPQSPSNPGSPDTPDGPEPQSPSNPGSPDTSDTTPDTTPDTPEPQSPSNPGSPDTPDTPDGPEPQSPSNPGSPDTPDTSPDVCAPTDADAGSRATARGAAGTGGQTAEDAGADTGKAGAACPDPAPEPCTDGHDNATADLGANQGRNPPADANGPPEERACRPSQEP